VTSASRPPEVLAALSLGARPCRWCGSPLPAGGTVRIVAPPVWADPVYRFCDLRCYEEWRAHVFGAHGEGARDSERLQAETEGGG